MVVNWFDDPGRLYDIEKSINLGYSWEPLASAITEPYTDPVGDTTHLYRVRDTLGSVWTPAFRGEPDSTVPVCTVFGYLRNAKGEPLVDKTIYIKPQYDSYYLSNSFYETEAQTSVGSDKYGYWEIDMVQGLPIKIFIPAIGLDRIVTAPALATCSLASIL